MIGKLRKSHYQFVIKVHQSQCRGSFIIKVVGFRPPGTERTHAHTTHTQTHRALVCYTVEIPELDFPFPPAS